MCRQCAANVTVTVHVHVCESLVLYLFIVPSLGCFVYLHARPSTSYAQQSPSSKVTARCGAIQQPGVVRMADTYTLSTVGTRYKPRCSYS